MAHVVVKLLTDDDGAKKDTPVWCLRQVIDAPRTLCSGEVYGIGESICTFKEKTVERGGITCPNCLEIIKWMKSIKL